jgi:uncharacterized membrane protein
MVFEEIVQIFAFYFGVIGAVLIIYGGMRAIFRITLLEVFKHALNYNDIRRDFVFKTIFGLEFFIAADVLKTLLSPTREEIFILGTVVAIRTVLAHFLSKEATEFQI